MLWPQPHVSSPRAAQQQHLCHLCSHLLPLEWHPLGIQRATSFERPKGARVGRKMFLGPARGSWAERLLEGSQGCPEGSGRLLWGSGCATGAFSNQDLPFHITPVQDPMAESESQGSLHPSHLFLLFLGKSPVLS